MQRQSNDSTEIRACYPASRRRARGVQPKCLMLDKLAGMNTAEKKQKALLVLKQLPDLIDEMLRMKWLFVDIKASNLGLYDGRLKV